MQDRPMTMKTSYEARCARIDRLRVSSQNRQHDRLERLEAKAEPMVGELASGRFYCYPPGGRYFESGSRQAVLDYLIRNKYVR